VIWCNLDKYTGYSLYEQADASKLWCGHERSFADWMNDKYPAFAKLGKPIMITELEIWGSPQKQRSWMEDAFATVGSYPLVKALIYFNAQDSVSWRKWGAPGGAKLAYQSVYFFELRVSRMVAGNQLTASLAG
jgi:beta-mannanase